MAHVKRQRKGEAWDVRGGLSKDGVQTPALF